MGENWTLKVSRIYRQSRTRVFAAWTTPEQLKQWFAPGQLTALSAEVDPRKGGALRIVWGGVSAQTGREMQVQLSGVFEQFVADELLRFSWRVEGDLGEDTRVTVEFRDAEGGTEVSISQERIGSEMVKNRNLGGWAACLEKLAASLEVGVEIVA